MNPLPLNVNALIFIRRQQSLVRASSTTFRNRLGMTTATPHPQIQWVRENERLQPLRTCPISVDALHSTTVETHDPYHS